MNIFKKAYNKLYSYDSSQIQTKSRIPYYDNAKFILIILVVIGHAIMPFLKSSPDTQILYKFIYLFHMPSFIIISGFFTKENNNEKRITGLFALYLISQVLSLLYEKFALHKNVAFNILTPINGLWFILALGIWSLILPVFTKLKPSVSIPIAVIAGLLIGYDKYVGDFFALSRIIVFFPLFLIGHYLSKVDFKRFFTVHLRVVSLIFLGVCAFYVCFFGNTVIQHLLNGNYSYHSMKLIPTGWAYRLVFYIIALLASFAFLILVPQCKTFFTKLGSRTLAVYVLHLVIYKVLMKFNLITEFAGATSIWLVVLVAVAVTFMLSWKPFSIPFNYMLKGDYKLLYKKQPKE